MKSIYFLIITFLSLIFISCSEDVIDGNAKGTLTGSVRLEATNEPLANVKITTTPATTTVFTDEKGNFEILGTLPLGDFSVRAELKGYVTDRKSTRLNSSHVKISYAV